MTVKTSASLTDSKAAFARELVEKGRFPGLSAMLQHGLGNIALGREADCAAMAGPVIGRLRSFPSGARLD